MARGSVWVPAAYYDDSGEEVELTAEGMQQDAADGAEESDASMESDDGQESVAADGRSKAAKVGGKRPKRSYGKPDMDRLEQERRLEKKQRRKVKDEKDRSWEDLNAKSAREHGKITLRTIAELTAMKQAAEAAGQDFQFMKVGTRFSCKEEVLLRIAEMNEFGRATLSSYPSPQGWAAEEDWSDQEREGINSQERLAYLHKLRRIRSQ